MWQASVSNARYPTLPPAYTGWLPLGKNKNYDNYDEDDNDNDEDDNDDDENDDKNYDDDNDDSVDDDGYSCADDNNDDKNVGDVINVCVCVCAKVSHAD